VPGGGLGVAGAQLGAGGVPHFFGSGAALGGTNARRLGVAV